MRSIQVSTDVFASIWSSRQPGENTEDDILRRVFDCTRDTSGERQPGATLAGVLDARSGVIFPEDFEVFRRYLGQEHRARATGGRWVLLSDGRQYATLNELSRAIGANENAWQNWFYRDERGQRCPVSDLRRPETIVRRDGKTGNAPPADKRPASSVKSEIERAVAHEVASDVTWRDDVRAALVKLGGSAALPSIYRLVEDIRRSSGRSVPRTLDAVIRRTLEDHSSDSANFRGADLFTMPEGKGAGVWALR